MSRVQIKGLEVRDKCLFIRQYKAKERRTCGVADQGYKVNALAAASCDPY
jgi:hypothetical protein